jgi:hypothetical protein
LVERLTNGSKFESQLLEKIYLAREGNRSTAAGMKTFTAKTKLRLVEWNLDPALTPIAAEFGMSVERFLELYTQRRLPGQLPNRKFNEDQDHDIDLGLGLDALKNPSAGNRIERAAKMADISVSEFLTDAIMDRVRCEEEEMVLSPRTGEFIGRDIDDFMVREEWV